MQVNSIKPQYRAYAANSVSLAGSTTAKKVVVDKVMQFLKENALMFVGEAKFAPKYDNLCHFGDVVVTGLKSPYHLLTREGHKKLVFNGTSMDDIAYQFAKETSGKTLYDPIEKENMTAMLFLGGNTKGYKYEIKVPDFFK